MIQIKEIDFYNMKKKRNESYKIEKDILEKEVKNIIIC